MSRFVKNIEDIQLGVKVEADTYFDAVDPYLESAENDYIKPYLGDELFEKLANTEVTPSLLTPIAKPLKIAISCFAFYHIINEGSLKINEHGAAQAMGDMQTAPSKWRDDNQKAELIRKGDKALDDLLDILTDHVDDYPEWKTSRHYTLRTSLIIGKASVFNDFVPIASSTRVFLRLLPDLKRADRLLKSYVCTDLYNRIKESLGKKEDDPDPMEGLMPYLQAIVAYETIIRAIPRFNFFITPEGLLFHTINDGTSQKMSLSSMDKKEMKARYKENLEESISELGAYLREHVENFPEYANSTCFGQKVSTRPSYAFVNKTTNKFFSP